MSSFFKELFRPGNRLGAVAPSSPELARRITRYAGAGEAKNILELGPGTGAFTRELRAVKCPDARYLGIELSPAFVKALRQNYPDLQVEEADIQHYDFTAHTDKHGLFDSVVSGLPWASFPASVQDGAMDNVCRHMKDGATFCTFAYRVFDLLPAGVRFRKKLGEHFNSIEVSPTLFWNFPPAYVYICRK